MLLQILCVRDSAAAVFGTPYFALSTGGAIRGFTDEVNRDAQGNTMNVHPEDFELYHLGVYDDATASFELLSKPVLMVRGKDVKK